MDPAFSLPSPTPHHPLPPLNPAAEQGSVTYTTSAVSVAIMPPPPLTPLAPLSHSIQSGPSATVAVVAASPPLPLPHTSPPASSSSAASASASASASVSAPASANRTARACSWCRRRKRKCDGVRPTCCWCAKGNLQCNYPSTLLKRGPQSGMMRKLKQKVEELEQQLNVTNKQTNNTT